MVCHGIRIATGATSTVRACGPNAVLLTSLAMNPSCPLCFA